jgi:hypothetical protein
MSTADATRDFAEIEADIARTRASLNRRLQELEQRLSPSGQLNEVRARLRPERFDPRRYPEWVAVAAVAAGAAMALAGWLRTRPARLDEGDLDDVVIFEVCGDKDTRLD